MALEACGIDRSFRVDGPGKVERNPQTGEPTGILRNCARYIKDVSPDQKPTEADRERRLIELLGDYNSVGITSIIDRDALDPAVERYERLHESGRLSVRVAISRHIETLGAIDKVLEEIRKTARHPLKDGGPRLRIVGIKTYLDGGMLTGSAYMREPWGVSRIYCDR